MYNKELIDKIKDGCTDFTEVNLGGQPLDNVRLHDLDFTGSSFREVTFNNCVFHNCTFAECIFEGANFINCKIENSNMSSSNFMSTGFIGSTFINVDFTNSDFRFSDFVNSNLINPNLSDVIGNSVDIFDLRLPLCTIVFYKDFIQLNKKLIKIEDFEDGFFDIKECFPVSSDIDKDDITDYYRILDTDKIKPIVLHFYNHIHSIYQ